MNAVEEKVDQVEEKAEYVKKRLEKEILSVKTDVERIKAHGTTVLPGMGGNKIKPLPTMARHLLRPTNHNSRWRVRQITGLTSYCLKTEKAIIRNCLQS